MVTSFSVLLLSLIEEPGPEENEGKVPHRRCDLLPASGGPEGASSREKDRCAPSSVHAH